MRIVPGGERRLEICGDGVRVVRVKDLVHLHVVGLVANHGLLQVVVEVVANGAAVVSELIQLELHPLGLVRRRGLLIVGREAALLNSRE